MGSNEYRLYRFDGSAENLEDDGSDFEHSETYQYLTDSLDNLFEDISHRFKYVAEEKTLYVFAAYGAGMNTQIQQYSSLHESWNNMLTSFSILTESCQPIITLSIYDGIDDVTEGHCTIMLVEELKDSDVYSPDSILGIISDGEITYSCLNESGYADNISAGNAASETDSSSSISDSSNSFPQTHGEENALKKALSYLSHSAFSYNGLIEQLEYVGFTHEQAVYGANLAY